MLKVQFYQFDEFESYADDLIPVHHWKYPLSEYSIDEPPRHGTERQGPSHTVLQR